MARAGVPGPTGAPALPAASTETPDMTDFQAWKSSPNAVEFLPHEIEQLQLGILTVCEECQWPRPVGGRCTVCPPREPA